MSGKKNPFLSIDALPVAFLCVAAFGLAIRHSWQIYSEHGMSIKRHSAGYDFELPKDAMPSGLSDNDNPK